MTSVLGTGAAGCVISPAFLCDSKTDKTNKVSKIFKKNSDTDAEREYQTTRILSRIDPYSEYFVYAISKCRIPVSKIPPGCAKILRSKTSEDDLFPNIVMENGGIEMLKYFEKMDNITVYDIFKTLITVVIGIDKLVNAGIVHEDIKPNNVLVDDNGIGRLIDFDNSVSFDDFYTDRNKLLNSSKLYSSPEHHIKHVHIFNFDDVDKYLHSVAKKIYEIEENIQIKYNSLNLVPSYTDEYYKLINYLKEFTCSIPDPNPLGTYNDDQCINIFRKTNNMHQKSDIYSFGILLLVISNRFLIDNFEILNIVIKKCLDPNPLTRASPLEISQLMSIIILDDYLKEKK